MMWLLLVGNASAWQSECFSTRQGVTGSFYLCKGAEEQATERWIPTEGRRYKHASTAIAEHWEIWNHAAQAGGLPAELQGAEILFEVYTRPDEYIPRHPAQEKAGSLEVVGRLREIGEVTQLPDMSYSLQDWARANSDCPLDEADLDGDSCHNFLGHLGALNSTHFLPQAQDWYMHLHGIALERAEACAAISSAGEHYEQTVLTCEKQALVVEAVAQHYLQDAWSSGHMWERWGSPDLETFDGKVANALAVGSFAGTWHGAKAVLDRSPLLPGQWDDPMCAHAPTNPWGDVAYLGTDGDLHPALGDLFWYVVVQGGDYAHQLDSLTTCSVAGMAEVYQATGQAHGPLDTVVDTEALYGEACWGQRVTNAALGVGSLVHKGATPNQTAFGGTPESEKAREAYGFAIATLLSAVLVPKGFSLDSLSRKEFRRDASELHALVGFNAKLNGKGTQLASGGLPRLLGAEANGHYQGLPEWADPPGPWSPTDPDPGVQALGLMFLETGIQERCDQDLDALEALRWSGGVASAADQAFCERMVGPHLRIGLGADSYDPRYEPICSDNILYSGHTNHGTLPFEEALEQYCGGVVLQDGGFEEPEASSPWTFKGGGAVGPGVYTLVPKEGAGQLDLGLNASSGVAYAIASQSLLAGVQGGEVVRFEFRMLGETPRSGDCASGSGPTFGLRLDDGEYGSGDAFRIVGFEEWCSGLEYWGGSWSITPEWQAMEAKIPVQSYEDPILSFYLVDNTSPDYHLLIDDVRLEKP